MRADRQYEEEMEELSRKSADSKTRVEALQAELIDKQVSWLEEEFYSTSHELYAPALMVIIVLVLESPFRYGESSSETPLRLSIRIGLWRPKR